MAKVGRPQKYFTDEERKAAKSRYNRTYYQKHKKPTGRPVGRPKQFTDAERIARKRAADRRYYAKKKAEQIMKLRESEYKAASARIKSIADYTIKDCYYECDDKEAWNEIGSPLGELIDEYGYDGKPVGEIYAELKNSGQTYLADEVMKYIMELAGIYEHIDEFKAFEDALAEAESNYARIANSSINEWL